MTEHRENVRHDFFFERSVAEAHGDVFQEFICLSRKKNETFLELQYEQLGEIGLTSYREIIERMLV